VLIINITIIRPHRSTTYIDAVYCYQLSSVVCQSVGLSVTFVIPAKMAEPIEMPFGLRTRVSPGNHVLDGGSDAPWEGAILRGKGASHCKVWGHSAVICAKTAKPRPIEMPFGLWAQMGLTNRALDGGPDPTREGTILGERGAYCKV